MAERLVDKEFYPLVSSHSQQTIEYIGTFLNLPCRRFSGRKAIFRAPPTTMFQRSSSSRRAPPTYAVPKRPTAWPTHLATPRVSACSMDPVRSWGAGAVSASRPSVCRWRRKFPFRFFNSGVLFHRRCSSQNRRLLPRRIPRLNLSHDQNRDYPNQPQGCGPWISSAILSQRHPSPCVHFVLRPSRWPVPVPGPPVG